MEKTTKKLAASLGVGALLLGALTPAAFANYNHASNGYDYKHASNQVDAARSDRFFTVLEGEEEVPGPGDPNGFGFARVQVNQGENEVCVRLRVINIDQATAAHIHSGVRGQAGPVVVTLPTPDERGRASGCVSISQDLAENLADHPSDYYVNVHNAEYPDGAIRGQL